MQQYKFFFLDSAGHVFRAEDHTFREDLDALEAAQKLSAKETIEVWQLGREVARVSPRGADAGAAERVSG